MLADSAWAGAFPCLVMYFVPFGQVGWCGEMPVARFRFAVWEYNIDDYSGTYFGYRFEEKLGGPMAYFGLEALRCRDGSLPTQTLD